MTETQQLEMINKHILEANKDLGKEIERLNNIINEAIEYIEKNVWSCYILDDEKELIETDSEELLKILKKGKRK